MDSMDFQHPPFADKTMEWTGGEKSCALLRHVAASSTPTTLNRLVN